MSDIEERLSQLEETLINADSILQQDVGTMESGTESVEPVAKKTVPYLYIAGALVPVLSAAGLYCMKPKWVTKKQKGKQVVDMGSLLKWVIIITVVCWVAMYMISKSAQLKNK